MGSIVPASRPRLQNDVIFNDRFYVRIAPHLQVLNRLTYGATQELLAEFDALGGSLVERLNVWLNQQLSPHTINDSTCEARLLAAGHVSLSKTLADQWADYVRASGADRSTPLREVEAARLTRAVCSRRQLLERMVEFWHDHFSVQGSRNIVRSVFVHYDETVIRPHAFGNFRELLEQNARSTAMLYYLDNHTSRAGGFNENYARELLELHTMGAEVYYPTLDPSDVPIGPDGRPAGYSDNDVYEAARALTGWTVRNGASHLNSLPEAERDTGEFIYWPAWHDTAFKLFLGRNILANGPAMGDGRIVFDEICQHRATARRLCSKLIRRFITDFPPEALVESAADVWQAHWQSPDQIAQVLRHLFEPEHLLSAQAGKLRRPYEIVVAALRLSDSQQTAVYPYSGTQWGTFFSRLNETGHRPFTWAPPDGFPDMAEAWASSSSMAMTWRMLSRLVELESSTEQPFIPVVDQTRAMFAPNQRTARKLLDWWLDRLLGFRPAPARYQRLLSFLAQNAGADEPLDLETSLPNGRSRTSNLAEHFVPARLRATIGLIFMLPEFQER